MKPTARQIANEARWALARESTSEEERRAVEALHLFNPRACSKCPQGSYVRGFLGDADGLECMTCGNRWGWASDPVARRDFVRVVSQPLKAVA